MPILTHFGFNWDQMTTWGALFQLMYEAVQNPVVVVAVAVSVWNCIVDPTTQGLSDSDEVLDNTSTKLAA